MKNKFTFILLAIPSLVFASPELAKHQTGDFVYNSCLYALWNKTLKTMSEQEKDEFIGSLEREGKIGSTSGVKFKDAVEDDAFFVRATACRLICVIRGGKPEFFKD